MNFLTADGVKFAHPLHHLQKSKEDLPLIAIDSFRHMYLFPKTEEMEVPGKLKEVKKRPVLGSGFHTDPFWAVDSIKTRFGQWIPQNPFWAVDSTQCGNFIIFLSLIFYVKSIYGILEF